MDFPLKIEAGLFIPGLRKMQKIFKIVAEQDLSDVIHRLLLNVEVASFCCPEGGEYGKHNTCTVVYFT